MLGTVAACVAGMLMFILALLISAPFIERADQKMITRGEELRATREARVAEELGG